MAKHGHIHTRFNAHSKGMLLPIHKGYKLGPSSRGSAQDPASGRPQPPHQINILDLLVQMLHIPPDFHVLRKMGSFHLSVPQMVQVHFWKRTFLTHF